MADTAVIADLSSPDPMRTARPAKPAAKPADAAPKPAPAKATDEPTKPQGDPLEGDEAPPKPEEKPEVEAPKPGEEAAPKTDEAAAKAGTQPDGKGGKVSPWKLVDTFKARVLTLEKELAETRQRVSDPAQLESLNKRIEAAEKRRAELEQEIVYHNYAKSEEFNEKYQKPYQEAWAKAVSELGELEVLGEDGAPARKATAQDLLALSNLPLGEARKAAKAWFGESADDVMAHRRRIRDLSDAQTKALEEARTKGVEHFKRQGEDAQRLSAEVTSLWQKFNAEDSGKHEFLQPKDGDEDRNAALTKATALVDKAFSESPHDPKLTTDQRAAIVRRHAAVRNRAIAYSTLKLENTRLKTQLAEREAKLKEFESSAPSNGDAGGRANGASKAPLDPMEAAKQRLRASAVAAPPTFY